MGPGLPVTQCRNPSIVTSLSTAFGVRPLRPDEAPTLSQWDPAFPFRSAKPDLRAFPRYDILSSTTAFDEAPTFCQLGPGLLVTQCRNPSLVTSLSTAFGFRSLRTDEVSLTLSTTLLAVFSLPQDFTVARYLTRLSLSLSTTFFAVFSLPQDCSVARYLTRLSLQRTPCCSQLPNSKRLATCSTQHTNHNQKHTREPS